MSERTIRVQGHICDGLLIRFYPSYSLSDADRFDDLFIAGDLDTVAGIVAGETGREMAEVRPVVEEVHAGMRRVGLV